MVIFKVTLRDLLLSIPHNLVYVIFAIGINEEGNSIIFVTLPGCKLAVSLALHVNVCGVTRRKKQGK